MYRDPHSTECRDGTLTVAENNSAYLEYRMRVLPTQLERARRRYEGLLREAREYGFDEILTEQERNDAL